MIGSKRGLVTTGVLTLVLGVIIMFPARVAIEWFVPAEIPVSGIKGSVWSGSANEAAINGVYLQGIHWSLNALRLFTGELSYSVEATPVSGFFESDISIGFTGALNLSNLSAAFPLEQFASASGLRGLQGKASLSFERVEIVDGLAIAADGTAQVSDLLVPIISRDYLGSYKAEFFTQNNGIAASVEDTDGVLGLAGSLQVRADRSYEFIGQVVAKPDTPENLRQQLRFLPPANDRGQQEVRLEGIL